jgi:glycosyltransferase involved in cell wall biosynthesis
MPVYNGARFVATAISSALGQTRKPDEIVIVNDGSKDDTIAVIESGFGGAVTLVSQKNAGPAAARNHGVRLSRGHWLAFLDADDEWHPAKLERQLRFASDPAVGVISCGKVYEGFDRPAGAPTQLLGANAQASVSPVRFDDLWPRNRIGMSCALCRREAYLRAGGFDEDPALIGVEDYNFWLKIAAGGWGIVHVNEYLCRYAPGPQSLTAQVERFARAEFANLEKIGRQLELEPARIEEKRARLLDEYGRQLLYVRNRKAARAYLGTLLRIKPSASAFVWWLACFAPRFMLDARRQLRNR